MKPFLKWAGGKRKLVPVILKEFPDSFLNYHEVFVGAGALFLSCHLKKVFINDKNPELINCYRFIKNNVDDLIKELEKYQNTKEFFLEIRGLDRLDEYKDLSEVKKAARFIFLNKTCFNGLYRVNKNGYFNVPFGDYKNPCIVDKENLIEIHKYLNENNVCISNKDFEEYLKDVNPGDFVYLDPPYDPLTKTSDFTSYDKDGFSKDDQERLKKCLDLLTKNDIKWILSNSCTDFIKELYKDYTIIEITANRSISCNGEKRGKVKEVLVKNF